MRYAVLRTGTLLALGILSTVSNATETVTYQYDALGRLTQSFRAGGPIDGTLNNVAFDAADNRSEYDLIQVNKGLNAGQSLTSSDGRTQLTMQTDGNLVVFFQGTALWNAGESGSGAVRMHFQSDGNMVLYTSSNAVVWYSHTNGQYGSQLSVQNDGNVVIYDRNGVAIWATNTGGHS